MYADMYIDTWAWPRSVQLYTTDAMWWETGDRVIRPNLKKTNQKL